IGFRVPNNDFCKKLISEFGKPIVSTSANLSEDKAPSIFEEINIAIKESVDYIVDYQKDKNDSLPSRLIKLDNDGSFEIIR
ncbi:MAG: Sua5/YciO/YrdC/YwlC family protein, partial [Bacteroidota bacterium]|nr:Sua5/YciO/YrdC/YwlC family protein [Bacteroidota bacterium]